MKSHPLVLLCAVTTFASHTCAAGDLSFAEYKRYSQVIEKTRGMMSDPRAWFFSRQYGLDVLALTWEDSARYYNSSVGPNISDMTIQVIVKNPKTGDYELPLMPIIRFPNFSDLTADIPLEDFYLQVGNHKGKSLEKVDLREFLGNTREYLTKPESWKGGEKSLLAPRDSHALVSAQACFLPIAPQGEAEFNPVVFNYQSYERNPAVLTVLAIREGTSVTVIDNKRDGFKGEGFTWGQRLFFNDNGERASLTGRRKSDYVAGAQTDPSDEPQVEAAKQRGLNVVLLIQVPLLQRPPRRGEGKGGLGGGGFGGFGGGAGFGAPEEKSDVEEAVISHGEVEGPFTELDDLPIKRDPRYPIRVTVQFYQATSNGVVSAEDMAQIAAQIDRVYKEAKYVGSLVVGGPTDRPTEYAGSKIEPPWWWDSFWRRYERNHGVNRWEAIRKLRTKVGRRWIPRTRTDMVRALRKI